MNFLLQIDLNLLIIIFSLLEQNTQNILKCQMIIMRQNYVSADHQLSY